jgi:phosphoglycerate dehydrogenase-like enzyme
VQLPGAGVENFATILDDARTWTSGKGMNAMPVAEHAIALALAGLRSLHRFVVARRWEPESGTNLIGAEVAILGGGEVAGALIKLLRPFKTTITVVRQRPQEMRGASRVLGDENLHEALSSAKVVIIAMALTPNTIGIIGETELSAMRSDAWLVNVARGRHVATPALVQALSTGQIGGAALDVTDPEPLPTDHPLWREPRCIITPHVGCTEAMARPLLFHRVRENVRRYGRGEPLLGVVSPELGY